MITTEELERQAYSSGDKIMVELLTKIYDLEKELEQTKDNYKLDILNFGKELLKLKKENFRLEKALKLL
jgi:hypothetical protein